MKKISNLLFFVFLSSYVLSQTVGFKSKKTPFVRAVNDYFGNSVSVSNKYQIVGSYNNSTDSVDANSIGTAGAAYIFELDNNQWVQKQKLTAVDRLPGDQFGFSVAISGNYAVVGAPYWDSNNAAANTNEGAAYIYKRSSNGKWLQVQRLLASDKDTADNFGNAVAISGNFMVIGAFKDEQDSIGQNRRNNSGSAYFFERDTINDIWIQVKKVVGSHRSVSDNFGNALSINGTKAVIGSMYHSLDSAGGNSISSAGAAYVFERNASGNWLEVKKITAPDRSYQSYFGASVSISENNIAIGAYFEGVNTTGAVYLFQNNINEWSFVKKLTASDQQSADSFGRSVSLDHNYLMVGAYGQDFDENGINAATSAGAAYFFVYKNSSWIEMQKIVAPDRASSDFFGFCVSISDGQISIGSHFNKSDSSSSNVLNNAGAIYTFQTCVPGVFDLGSRSICSGDSMLIFGIYQKSEGLYTSDTMVSVYGCDSIATLYLTVNPLPQVSFTFDTDTTCIGGLSLNLVGSPVGGTFDGVGVSGNLFDPALVSTSGFYSVNYTYTDSNTCSSSSADSIYVDVCTGENKLSDFSVSLFPNPASSFVEIVAAFPKTLKIDLINVDGKLVYSDLLKQNKKIDLSSFASGIYIVKISSENGSRYYKLIRYD